MLLPWRSIAGGQIQVQVVDRFILGQKFFLPFHEILPGPLTTPKVDLGRAVANAGKFECPPDVLGVARTLRALVVNLDSCHWLTWVDLFFHAVEMRVFTVLFVLSLQTRFNFHGFLQVLDVLGHFLEISLHLIDLVLDSLAQLLGCGVALSIVSLVLAHPFEASFDKHGALGELFLYFGVLGCYLVPLGQHVLLDLLKTVKAGVESVTERLHLGCGCVVVQMLEL